MIKISTWGVIVALVYFSLTGSLYLYAIRCHGMFCDIGVGLTVLPWAFFWENDMRWYWVGVSINVIILYFFFATLQRLLKK